MKIKVINKQNIDGQTDEICEEAEGKYFVKDNKKFIIYSVSDNGTDVSVMITVSDTEVKVKRTSSVRTVMTFCRDRVTVTKYGTPYGDIFLKITTEKIVNALNESGGKLRLVYTTDMQGQIFYNDMQIEVN